MSTLETDEMPFQDGIMSDLDDPDYNEHNIEDRVLDEDDEVWAEGFEGPNDDDLFVERPVDHAIQEMIEYRALMRAERRKMLSNTRKRTTDSNATPTLVQAARNLNDPGYSNQSFWMSNRGEGGWYSEDESQSDEELDRSMVSDSEKEEDNEMYEEWKEKNYPDMDKFEMRVGMKFKSRGVYRAVLRDWVVRKGWDIKLIKSEEKKITAVCKGGCSWHIHASYQGKTSTFQVKTIRGEHACSHVTKNSQANYKYIGRKLVPDFRIAPIHDLELLKRKVMTLIKVEASEHVLYRAKRYALYLIKGDIEIEYNRLWDYCATVGKESVGSKLQMKLNKELNPPALERMYFGLKGLRDGFLAGCRPIIGLDGCFLKGPFGGHLLSAVGRDANDNVYPIAMAYVRSECYETWHWFLQILREDIGTFQERGWAFMSDRQKGLINAVVELFADAEHRFCARHLYNNFKEKFKGLDMKVVFWRAATACTTYKFKKIMQEIKDAYPAIDEHEVTPHVWLSRIDPTHWTRSHFPKRTKCNTLVNNMCESFNSYILGSRDLPIISMWEWIRNKLMKRIQIKRAGMERYEGSVCPNIVRKMLKDKVDHGHKCFTTWAGGEKYSVEYKDDVHVVKLDERTCSCGLFQLQGYPCCHAISAIELHKKRLEDYVGYWYKKETFLAIYSHVISLVPGPKFYEDAGKGIIQPLIVPVKIGRPKKKRRKDRNDIRDPSKASRKGHQKTCSKCLGVGHNYLSCKNPVHIIQNTIREKKEEVLKVKQLIRAYQPSLQEMNKTLS